MYRLIRKVPPSPLLRVSTPLNICAPLDVRASVGKNLIYLRSESSLDPWYASPSDLRAALNDRRAHIPLVDRWRLGYLARLLQERGQLYYDSKDTGSHTRLICIN